MPYMVICKKDDGSIEVAAHAGEAPTELLQDAQPAQTLDEAVQLVKDVLGDVSGEQTAPAGGPESDAAPTGAEGMPMESQDDAMAAGFQRAKKGY